MLLYCSVMHTQIALGAEQHAMVSQRAASLGITTAEYIRRLVDQDLGRGGGDADVSAIIGIGCSGGSDIAAEGQAAVTEAVAAFHEAR